MGDVDQSDAGSWPLYLGANKDGTHKVMVDGGIHDLPYEGLTPPLQADAIQLSAGTPAAQAPQLQRGADGSPSLFSAGFKNLQGLHNAMGSVPVGEQTTDAIESQLPQTGGASGSWDAAPGTGQPPPGGGGNTPSTEPEVTPTPAGQAPPTAGGGGGGGNLVSGMETAEADRLNADEVQRDISTKEAAENLEILKQQQADEKAENDAHAIKQAAIQQSTQEMLKKATDAADRFQNATINPNSMWQSKDTGQRMTAAAALLVSGIGSGIQGTQNLAVKALNDAQDRDLEAQKWNIQHNKEASDQYRSLYSDFRQAGLDENASHAATGLAIKYKADQEMQKVILAHGGEQALQKYMADTAQHRAEFIKDTSQVLEQGAATAAARANTSHTLLENAQLAQSIGATGALKQGQANLAKGVTWDQLVAKAPDQARAIMQDAAGKKTLIPNVGIAQREVSPEDQNKVSDVELAKRLWADINKEAKGGGGVWSEGAASKADALKAVMQRLLGSKAPKENESAQAALNNIVKGGKFAQGWHLGERQRALKSTIGEIEDTTDKSLGITRFRPKQTMAQANALGAVSDNG